MTASTYKGKPLDSEAINRINHLWFVAEMRNKSLIARRLGISVTTVRAHLMTQEEWDAKKES